MVAAVDVHVVSDGPEAVRGIEISIALHVGDAPPQSFALIGGHNLAQVVEVGGFSVGDVAEDSVANHLENRHLGGSIAAVFENDAMFTGGFGGVHDVPAF